MGEQTGIGILAPRILVRLEGAAAFALALYFYARVDESWILFLVLFLAPDLSILVYLFNRHLGAAAYNLVHTYLSGAALIAFGVAQNSSLLAALGLIWIAHIGIDRFLGFGLKYPTDFKDTHLQRL